MYKFYNLFYASTMFEIILRYVDLVLIIEICVLCDFAMCHVCVIL
jgi:hypothetical protein